MELLNMVVCMIGDFLFSGSSSYSWVLIIDTTIPGFAQLVNDNHTLN